MRAHLAGIALALAAACSSDPRPTTAAAASIDPMLDWVAIPAGEVVAGDLTGTGRDDERPARRLRIEKPFEVSRTEVTNAQYTRFVTATGKRPPNDWKQGQCPADQLQHAVTHVSWQDAQEYCAWAGVRLLTEAEWEYCARGTTSWAYPFGDLFFPELANCRHVQSSTQEPVASHAKGASPFGVQDLAGGVWEWVQDRYDEHRLAGLRDGDAASACEQGIGRVLKGGAWTLEPRLARISARDRTSESAKGLQIGFRVARSCRAAPGLECAR